LEIGILIENAVVKIKRNPNPGHGEPWSIQHCQRLAKSRWFSPGTPVSSTNKTDRHDITETLLKVALNTITLNQKQTSFCVQFLIGGRFVDIVDHHLRTVFSQVNLGSGLKQFQRRGEVKLGKWTTTLS
jgi:hypothetical protein